MIELYNDFSSDAWSAVVYGPAGIGKTTFAARAPGAMIVNLENGLKGVDLAGCEAVATGYIDTYRGFKEALGFFEDSEYQTLVIDSLTRLEGLIEEEVCREENASNPKKVHNSLADFGFGRGSVALAAKFGELLEQVESLKAQGKNVIMLAHTKVATFNDPECEAYDSFDLALDKKVVERIKAAADHVWFMHQEKTVKSNDKTLGNKGGRATYYNRILIQTRQSGGVAAKTRGNRDMYIEVKNDNTAKGIWNGL